MYYMIKKKNPKRKTHKPAKKSRTKTRKPKFLSLISLELSKIKQSTTDMPPTTSAAANSSSSNGQQQQLNLFPLHPENTDENNMAYLFSAADGPAASTLTGLLGTSTATTMSCSEEASASQSYAATYGSEVKEAVALVRTALRNKERDSSEERYVRYSEVVERRDEEVTSSAAVDLKCGNRNLTVKIEKKEKQRLSLKLDYEEILNAWSDKGPLYIFAEDSPQIVPDIHDNFLAPGLSNGIGEASLWSVPELSISNPKIHEMKKEEEEDAAGVGLEEWKLGKRKASVLRYKEKRHNRLFSKQIRYHVRKLNAEKRPRVKGRFVKRS